MTYSPAHINSCAILAAISRPCSCGRDEAARRLNEFDGLQAQLAQAVEAKQSATTMSEERLARALRAEDEAARLRALTTHDQGIIEELHKRAESPHEGCRETERSLLAERDKAESDLKLMGMQLNHIAFQQQKERADEAEADRETHYKARLRAEAKLAEVESRLKNLEALTPAAAQRAEAKADEAEARAKDLEAVQGMMEAYRDERREALRVLNADFYSIGDLQGDPSWLTPAAALKLRKMLNAGPAEARADAALTRVHDLLGLKGSNRCLDGVQTAVRAMEVRAADAERSRVWAETQATKALARADAAETREAEVRRSIETGFAAERADEAERKARLRAEAKLAEAESREAAVQRSCEIGFAAERADRTKAEVRAADAEARADAAETRLQDGCGNEAPRSSFASAKALKALGWLNLNEAKKLREERDFAVDKCRAAIAREAQGVRSAIPRAEHQKLQDAVEAALVHLDDARILLRNP